MYKMLFGMMAGVTLTLAGTHLFQAEKSASQNKLSQPQTPTAPNLERAVVQIVSELALLQASIDELNAKVDNFPELAQYAAENAKGPSLVAAQVEMTDTQSDYNVDAQVVAFQKQDLLNRLGDPGITLPNFMASEELSELPSDARDEIMQELVRRFNSGEIDREQFVPGYRY
jgi:FtsZ-binding cell division protein ZapB